MTDFAPAELPLQIDRVQGSRPSAGEIRLALSGSWHGPEHDAGLEPLLVVQVEGRRHRFPADRDQRAGELAPGRWRATFSVPDWAQPRQEGQAAVWIGNAVVPVPPLHGSHRAPAAVASAVPASYLQAGSEPEVEAEGSQYQSQPWDEGERTETPRSGPLADLLLKETVAALHAELETRAAEAARLQGALGDARAELEARTDTQSQLETTLAELSAELKRLMVAVEEQRGELERHRAQAQEEREALERRLGELTEAHERQIAELTEAHEGRIAELTDAHARERAELTARHEERLTEVTAEAERQAAASSEQLSELSATRAELAELRAGAEARDDDLRRARDAAAGSQAAIEQQEAESARLREELAASHVAREAALSEVAGLQAELSRIGGELAVTRERVTSETGDLGQANRLLAEAKALAEQLRRERDG